MENKKTFVLCRLQAPMKIHEWNILKSLKKYKVEISSLLVLVETQVYVCLKHNGSKF